MSSRGQERQKEVKSGSKLFFLPKYPGSQLRGQQDDTWMCVVIAGLCCGGDTGPAEPCNPPGLHCTVGWIGVGCRGASCVQMCPAQLWVCPVQLWLCPAQLWACPSAASRNSSRLQAGVAFQAWLTTLAGSPERRGSEPINAAELQSGLVVIIISRDCSK